MKTKHLIIALFTLVLAVSNVNANNMLVQNVTTLNDNPSAKTVQVQFDLSWDNSWRDSINWDAAWIFLKFKDANGLWQHAKLNTNGFQNGSGTTNTVQVTSDNVGAWVYRDTRGSGTFNSTTMQLQWNYGLSGLSKVTGLEVRVFAVEMVYVPEGGFNCAGAKSIYGHSFYYIPTDSTNYYKGGNGEKGLFCAPGDNFPVINKRLSPTLNYFDGKSTSLRIKGDAGIDTDNNGTVDNNSYPIGYKGFYCYKYELTEQQYADFLNTLNTTQVSTIGIAGTGITISNGQYFSSTPNKACNNATANRLFAFADWSGVRPISFLEFNKVSYGPLQPQTPHPIHGYPAWSSNQNMNNLSTTATNAGYAATTTSNRISSGASYYGVLELTGSTVEPVVRLSYTAFTSTNGNGILLNTGISDISNWKTSGMLIFVDNYNMNAWNTYSPANYGFRYVRSAE
jgi:hypothetical protein